MIERLHQPGRSLIALTNFDDQSPLTNGRKTQIRRQPLGDSILQTKANETGRRQHDRLEVEFLELPQPCLHIAAQ